MLKNKLVLGENTKFKDAIKMLDHNGNGFLAIVNRNNKLIGILTDGDIRRAILDNKTELLDIVNRNPATMDYGVSKKSAITKLKKLHRRHMPIIDKNGILQDVITFDDDEFNIKPNWVVIMAGGLGTRLGELTKETPKPMLRVNDKPMLEHIIEMFTSHGFTKFMLSVNYKSAIIKNYFGDGSRFGIEIRYLEETIRLGTGGSLSLINMQLNEPFFVTNGDVLTSIDYENLLDYHNLNNSKATMCIRKSSYQVPYGVVEVDSNNRILHLKEKPKYDFYINAGLYVLSSDILELVPSNTFFDLPNLFKILQENSEITKSYEISDYWIDIGTPKDFDDISKKMS